MLIFDVSFIVCLFVLAAAIAIPEGIATSAAVVGGRAAMGLAGGGLTAGVGRISKHFTAMSPKKKACWKKAISDELEKFRERYSQIRTPRQEKLDSIFKSFPEATKETEDEYQKLTEDLEGLKKWSADLKRVKPQPR